MGSFVHGNRWTAAREQKVASRLRRASPRPIAWCVIRTSGAAVHCTTRAIGAAWIASWLHDAAPRAAPAVLPGRVSMDYGFFCSWSQRHISWLRGEMTSARVPLRSEGLTRVGRRCPTWPSSLPRHRGQHFCSPSDSPRRRHPLLAVCRPCAELLRDGHHGRHGHHGQTGETSSHVRCSVVQLLSSLYIHPAYHTLARAGRLPIVCREDHQRHAMPYE